jgi:anti-sigma factor RsiW
MNEQAQASKICRYLDQGSDQLSYRVQERLAAARAAALAKVVSPTVETPVIPPVAREPVPAEEASPWWWRLAATAVPLLLVAGIFLVDLVHQEQSAAELAEVDAALLTDDVPLVAYADHGFGVYIQNSRR